MHPAARVLALVIAVALSVAGCTTAPVEVVWGGQSQTSATQPSGGEISISPTPGVAVDRPRLPEANPKVEGMVDGLAGSGLSGYLAQVLNWRKCGDAECTEVLAPLDYEDPSARAVTLSLKRKRGAAKARLGSLFINPGGPGGSGKDLVDSIAGIGLDRYDIVGWDPRGTGDSTRVRCFGAAESGAYFSMDKTPDTEAERTELIEATYAFGRSCWERSGDLLEHISTIETVRDLDLLRRLLGDKKLNFLGYSYGTQIGATYAELFPQNTGRLVLDAAVNITNNDDVIQAMGFDTALGNFARWCAQEKCSLGATEDAVIKTITGLFDKLDAEPLPVKDRTLTESLAVSGVAMPLYWSKSEWGLLQVAIEGALMGNGEGLLSLSDTLNSRQDNGEYSSMAYAFPAISCLDSAEDMGVLAADKTWVEDQAKAPVFGKYLGPQYECALWPARPAPQLDIRGAGAAPILVIGSTGDPATPYQQAVSMAKQLESGVLVTRVGEGHGSFHSGTGCVGKIVTNYFLDGVVPADGVRCG